MLKRLIPVVVTSSLVLIFSFLDRPPEWAGPVTVSGGQIRGVRNAKTGVTAYRGLPFAAPPVGPLRWKTPQPVKPWNGVRDCVAFGPSPMQNKPMPFFMIGPEFTVPQQPVSEDCLYLNVWTAAASAKEKRPVMVWIYGGGFFSGGAAAPGTPAKRLLPKVSSSFPLTTG